MNRYDDTWLEEFNGQLPTLLDMIKFVKSSEDFQEFMITENLPNKLDKMRHINRNSDFIAPFE